MRKYVVFAASFLAVAGASLNSGAVTPMKGATLLEARQTNAKLVLVGMSKKDGRLVSADFVWIPESSENICFEKSLNKCREDDHDRSDKTYKGEAPTQVLLESVGDSSGSEGGAILAALSKIGSVKSFLKEENTTDLKMPLVDKSNIVKARIRWELWSNGENFRVLEIIE